MSAIWYHSPVTNAERRMLVYTPPGYETSKKRHPVLYLFHGGDGNEDNWVDSGLAHIVNGAAYEPFDAEALAPGFFPGFFSNAAATNRRIKLLYFSCGTEDPRIRSTEDVARDPLPPDEFVMRQMVLGFGWPFT